MKRFIIILVFLIKNFSLNAQSSASKNDTIPSKVRIDLSFLQFIIGPWFSETKSNLPDESSFILNNKRSYLYSYPFELQFLFKDKLGFEVGFDFFTGDLNKKKIRNDFQSHIYGYNTNIPSDNEQKGESPFKNGYNFSLLKIGVVGFLPRNKKNKTSNILIPFCDYLYNIESSYPSVNIKFTELSTNSTFNREYVYKNIECYGAKIGTSIRHYYWVRSQVKHASLYLQLRVEFTYIKINGEGYYIDTDLNNNTFISNSNNFSQNHYSILVGFSLGGFDLHW